MKRAICLILAVAAATAGVRADSLRAQMDKCYAIYRKAWLARDAKLLMSQVHPDFTYQGPHSAKPKRMSAAQMSQGVAMVKSVASFDVKILGIQGAGNKATVRTLQTMVGKMIGPDGKPHTMVSIDDSMDGWVKTPKGWKIRSVKSISSKMTLDGKRLGSGAAPVSTTSTSGGARDASRQETAKPKR